MIKMGNKCSKCGVLLSPHQITYGDLCTECGFKKLQSENDTMIDILSGLLGCGCLDLRVILDCKYDMCDLKEELDSMGCEKPDLNNLAYAMFYLGKHDIQHWIEERIDEIEGWDDEIAEDKKQEREALRNLDPYEDIESFHNYIDTSVYFNKNAEIYKKYCQEALDEFQDKTGYEIGG